MPATCRSSILRCTAWERHRLLACSRWRASRVSRSSSRSAALTLTSPTSRTTWQTRSIPALLQRRSHEARKTGADLVVASDPDADRIGVAVPVSRDPHGEWTTLDGNQIGVVARGFRDERMPGAGQAEARPLSDHDPRVDADDPSGRPSRGDSRRGRPAGRLQVDRQTESIEAGPHGFLFAFEESHGYLKGTHARDKDAAVGALLFAELAATVKDRKQTVLEFLDDLFIDVGHHDDRLINKFLEGREGLARINQLMGAFRERPPRRFGGLAFT